SLNMREFAKDLIARVDLFPAQRLQPLSSEAFDRERSHHSAVEHGAFEDLAIHLLLRGDVPHKASGKGIARSSWIPHFFHGQCGSTEGMIPSSKFTVFEEDGCAILAMLDYQSSRTELQYLSRCTRNACLAGNELGFVVVDQQNIYTLESLEQILAMV